MEIGKYFDEPCEVCDKPSCFCVNDYIEYRRPGQIKIYMEFSEKHYFCSEHFRESKTEIIQLGEEI